MGSYELYGSNIYRWGRPIRPLFIAENGKLLFNQKINDFILKNKCWRAFSSEIYNKDLYCIEHLDPHESSNSLISVNMEKFNNIQKNYTHSEIHPSLILVKYLPHVFHFHIIIKLNIHINRQWGNKQ